MKLITSFILILSIFSNYSFANQYVNFQYFTDSSCSNPNLKNGIGASFILNTCIDLDNNYNYLFSNNESEISWGIFYNLYTNNGTCDKLVSNSISIPNDACVPYSSSTFYFVNSNTNISDGSFYYKVSVSSKPLIPNNQVVSIQMGERCTSDNIITASYSVNPTFSNVDNMGDTFLSFCSNGVPYGQACSDEGCGSKNNLSQHCRPILPFYNASSSTETSSEAGSSYSSDDSNSDQQPTTGAISGSVSGGSSGSGSALLNAQQDLINHNGKGYSNQQFEDIPRKYFLSIYCS